MRLSVLLALAFAGVTALALALAAGIAHLEIRREVPVLMDQIYASGAASAPGVIGATPATATTPTLAAIPGAIATILAGASGPAGGVAAGAVDGGDPAR
ncbi:MAG: hypothetical protein M3Z04_20780 [Chloroflexota bacterium]|nr:hypothetical protein [Chloroflexota bacterium]